MKKTLMRFAIAVVVLVLATNVFADSFARPTFSFFTNQSGSTPMVSTEEHTNVRLGISMKGVFTNGYAEVYGQSVNGPEIYIGRYVLPDANDVNKPTSVSVDIPTVPDMLRISAGANGFPGKTVFVTVEFWGTRPPLRSERAVEFLSSAATKLTTSPFDTDVINIEAFNEIRVGFDARLVTGTMAVKPPIVTVLAVLGSGDLVPIASVDPTRDTTMGGSIVLRSPPSQIRLRFAKATTTTGSDLFVRWHIWGIPVKD